MTPRPIPRVVALCPSHDCRCPHGHPLPSSFFPAPAGVVRCQHRSRDADGVLLPPCGAFLYVVAVHAAALALVVAPLSWPEAQAVMRLAPMPALAALGVAHLIPSPPAP